jgi:hypothetical protein
MLLVRDLFQTKYGRGDELVALFREMMVQAPVTGATGRVRSFRILTDASGPFFTVVTEMEVEGFAAWPQVMAEEFAHPSFAEWFARMVPLVESGRREFFNVVATSTSAG